MVEISGSIPAPLKLGFAGDTFNTAVYLSRLIRSQGGRVEYITGLGTDMLSRSMQKYLRDCGVGSSHIRTVDQHHPGLYVIETTSAGERIFHYWRGEAAVRYFLDKADPDQFVAELSTFGGIYLSGISIAVLTDQGKSLLFDALCEAKKKGVQVFFDSNYRPALWKDRGRAQSAFAQFVPLADIAMMTDRDLADLYAVNLEEVPHAARQYGVPELVLKRGEFPCLIWQEDNQYSIPACIVGRVIDTTAAGDSFNAAYLAARLKGCPPKTAALCGHMLAARVIQQHGAIIDPEQMPEISLDQHCTCACSNHAEFTPNNV